MMTREQLKKLTLPELQTLGKRYGVRPIGNWGKTEAWVNTLSAFPYKALEQMRDGVGVHSPGLEAYHAITVALDLIGHPTDSQLALLRATKNNEWLQEEYWRRYQQKLVDLWSAKLMLEEVLKLLVK